MRLVQQRQVQADPQREQREAGQREMQCQLQALRKPRDVDEAQPGVHRHHRQRDRTRPADVAAVLMPLVRRSGEPQRGTDQAAHGGRGQRHGDAADARLDDQSVHRPDAATMPPANCGASRVSVAAAVNISAPSAPIAKPSKASRFRAGESHHQRRDEHEHQAAHRHAEPVAKDPRAGDPHAQADVVGPRHHRAGQQHPADAESDARAPPSVPGCGGMSR